jgi:hypothetical protein
MDNAALSLTRAEKYEMFYKYVAMEGAGNATEQGADIPQIIEDLAVEYVTTDEIVKAVILDNTFAGPC